ncbi:MAG: hypothetical protein ABIF85_00170 [Nanoarchaeota archaeon]|nr:hypothetical protein [Nanoarchaeota archaeon]MBU4300060.1 hypothetical protein [Nanoarchaeota archaeon]MBU4451861.1 hypothetical protein [Nanoarchaeota archaeon]MCG2724403.1 hypothetical protein [archaeon]
MAKNITTQIWKYISNDASIKKLLHSGLINNRALAKKAMRDLGLRTSTETIVSAIRRYDDWENKTEETYKKARELLKKSTFSSKSNIACITLKKDIEIRNILPHIFSGVDFSKGEVLRIVQGELFVKVIVDEHNLAKIIEIIPENFIVKTTKGLAELNVIFDGEAENTPGLVSVVTNELSSNNVNMQEVLTCVPELIILVKEKDFLNGVKILYGLIKE